MLISDEQLVLLAQNGDSAARDHLAARYIDTVSLRARGYLEKSPSISLECDDLGQEGFIGLLGAIGAYDTAFGASFRTFAILNIDCRITDAVRAACRKKQVPCSAKIPFDDAFAAFDGPEDTAIARDELQRVIKQIELITSDKERRVLKLHLNGYSYSEIAKRLDCSAKSVENALSRVRRKLKGDDNRPKDSQSIRA